MMRGISIPPVRRTFGFATHARQTGAIAWTSFWTIAKSPAGLVLPAVAMLLVLLVPVVVKAKGVSLLPTTALVLSKLTAPVADNPRLPWVLIPLLIIHWAGELVWRERDAGLGEIADATPVREWVLVLGKFLGLALVLVGWMALLIVAGVLVQMRMGYFAFELGLYLRILFGLQLVDYLIFALLVLVVHAVVNQKQLGYLAALVAYGAILFPSFLGIEHHLLIYGSGPRWFYSVVSGFGPSLGPWLWFKLYWAGWAVLLAIVASLLWPRGPERGWETRFRLARRRCSRGTARVGAIALAVIVTLGGFLFYHTNVLNRPASRRIERRAEYERGYAKYAGAAQPSVASTRLQVEIYPERRAAEIRGTQRFREPKLGGDRIHPRGHRSRSRDPRSFPRRAGGATLTDDDLGYRVCALEKPRQPGGSPQCRFAVQRAPHDFGNSQNGASGSGW